MENCNSQPKEPKAVEKEGQVQAVFRTQVEIIRSLEDSICLLCANLISVIRPEEKPAPDKTADEAAKSSMQWVDLAQNIKGNNDWLNHLNDRIQGLIDRIEL